MPHITTIGLDLAKHVFQVHGMDSVCHCQWNYRGEGI